MLMITWNAIHAIASQRPIASAKHKDSGKKRSDLDHYDQNDVIFKGALNLVFAEVKNQTGDSGHDVNAANDDDSDGPFACHK